MNLRKDLCTFLLCMLDVMDNQCSQDILDDNLVVLPYILSYKSTMDCHLLGDTHCRVHKDWVYTVRPASLVLIQNTESLYI